MNMPEESDDDLMPDSNLEPLMRRGNSGEFRSRTNSNEVLTPKSVRKNSHNVRQSVVSALKRFSLKRGGRANRRVRWIAFRDKHSMERSIRAAVFYDPAPTRCGTPPQIVRSPKPSEISWSRSIGMVEVALVSQ